MIKTNEAIEILFLSNKKRINARELYDLLEVKRSFIDWITECLCDNDLIESEHYTTMIKQLPVTEQLWIQYIFEIETAKEIAILETHNEVAKQIRQYLIDCDNNNFDPSEDIEKS